MQTFKFLAIAIFSFSSLFSMAQAKTESVSVSGNCGMCQGRIEKAAKAAGATSAKWDAATDVLTVSYDAAATSLSAIEAKVASIGHDTQNKTASKEAYNKLHGCCQYDRKVSSTSAVSCCNTGASCCTSGGSCCSKSATTSTTSVKDCCADGAACCKAGQNCCAKPTVGLATTSAKDCCAPGTACCGSAQACCSKATAVNTSAKDCCASGASCCAPGADCCPKTAAATAQSTKNCCSEGNDCCADGNACCTKSAVLG